MSLPSRYSYEGLSKADQSRVITLGIKRSKPIEYKLRNINDKIQDQIDYDIQMSPINDEGSDIIASFVEYSRNKNSNYDYSDLSIEQSEIVLDGNTSLLVIDTNFLLSQLNILDEINKLASKYKLKIIIPLYVIKELDGLKNSKEFHSDDQGISTKSVSYLARWANDWIYSNLANSSDTVKIQKPTQQIKPNLVKDEAILDCCLYFKLQYLTILFSNDKNLCALALNQGVLTVSYNKEMDAESICDKIYQENVQRHGIRQEVRHEQYKKKQVGPSKEWIEKTQEFGDFHSKEEVIEKIYSEIQLLLLSVLHHCMVKEYEDNLHFIRDYDKNQIITLHDCSQLIIRFWYDFKFYLRSMPPFIEKGNRKVPIFTDHPTNYQDLQEFINFWSSILYILYQEVMDETEQLALKYLIQRWESMSNLII